MITRYQFHGGPATGGQYPVAVGTCTVEEGSDYDLASAIYGRGDLALAIRIGREWLRRYPERPAGYKSWAQNAHTAIEAAMRGLPSIVPCDALSPETGVECTGVPWYLPNAAGASVCGSRRAAFGRRCV